MEARTIELTAFLSSEKDTLQDKLTINHPLCKQVH